MAVRSVQLMVDRGELRAWKTPGGHRRIDRASVEHWLSSRQAGVRPVRVPAERPLRADGAARVLLIEDSQHYQQLVSLLIKQRFPSVDLSIADNGIAGLAMAGQLAPRVLLVDLLLPGIDGATLIMSLRSHSQFSNTKLIVVTSLEGESLAPYRHALVDVPVVHKSRLMVDLAPQLADSLALPLLATR